ncbi:MAG: YbaK/prolyl-tRNA synthetase associated region [Parcubacteria group bacterium GW2011_GWC1_38_6]|nr:MAG: YbaK/prolyl-tRNA synthetase associated region [Parcubacteria group bacterium GW2011_GWC1_38_6]
MPMLKKLQKLLEDNKVKYEEINHRIVYTAHDKAVTLKIAEKVIGKTLVVKFDKSMALVLISANKNLDKQKLKKIAKSKKIDFAKEAWMKKNLKGVKLGSVPPFGTLWKLPTFIDRGLLKEKKVIVSSGAYNSSIKLNTIIFKKIIPDLVISNFVKRR